MQAATFKLKIKIISPFDWNSNLLAINDDERQRENVAEPNDPQLPTREGSPEPLLILHKFPLVNEYEVRWLVLNHDRSSDQIGSPDPSTAIYASKLVRSSGTAHDLFLFRRGIQKNPEKPYINKKFTVKISFTFSSRVCSALNKYEPDNVNTK